jgi:predicted CoA-binding protein
VNPPDATLRELLVASRTIAVVGHSDKPYRDSYRVAQYLRQAGYSVYAVNPNLRAVAGGPAYPDLRQLPGRVDIVDVFRRAEHLAQIVEEAIAIGARVVWGQFGVEDPAAAERAQAAGLVMVMDRCLKVEHARLGIPRRAI